MLNSAHLPDDIEALKALLLARDAQILGLEAQLNTRAAEIEHLKLTIAKLRRMQFGRKSDPVGQAKSPTSGRVKFPHPLSF